MHISKRSQGVFAEVAIYAGLFLFSGGLTQNIISHTDIKNIPQEALQVRAIEDRKSKGEQVPEKERVFYERMITQDNVQIDLNRIKKSSLEITVSFSALCLGEILAISGLYLLPRRYL
jgi:hypothetical protein